MRRLRSALLALGSRLAPSGPLDTVAYLLLAGFLVVTLGPALLGFGAMVDVDFLTLFQPFRAINGRSDGDFIALRQDTTDYYLPAMAVIKAAFLAGEFPTWAPYEVGGTPLASLPNHAALSPLSLPYFLLPLWLAPAFVKLGEFGVAIVGMVAFLGRHGVSRGAGVLAGIFFATSGFMMMWTNWPHTRVASLIPLLFWSLERLHQGRRVRDAVPVALVVASMLLGGFPAVTVFALTLAAAYVLARTVWRYRADAAAMLRVLVLSAAGVLLGAGLAAVQIVPFVRNLDQLGLENRNFEGRHLPFALLVTTVAPDAVGLSINNEPRWYGPVNPIEAVGFVGAVTLVLAVAALVLRLPCGAAPERSPRWFLAGAVAVAGTAIYVGGPVLAALQQLPFYSTNFIGRASSVLGFLVAALAGIGLERLLRWVEHRRGPASDAKGAEREPPSGRAALGRALFPAVLLAGVGVLGLLVVRAARAYAADADATARLQSTLLVPALLLVAGIVGVALIRLGPARLRPALVPMAGLVALLAVAQSAAFARTMLPLSDRSNVYPVTPTHAFLQAHIAGGRYGSSLAVMYPASSDVYRLRTPVGHEFIADRWKDVLRAADRRSVLTRTGSRFSDELPLAEVGRSAPLDQFAVRYWVAAPGDVTGRADEIPDDEPTMELEPGERAQCEVDGTGLRGVGIEVAEKRALPPPDQRALLHVAVHTPEGTLTGTRHLGSLDAGPQRVGLAGEDLPRGGRFRVEVWFTGLEGGTSVRTEDGELACAAVRPQDDGLRLVFAEAGATVYERLDALPRIRWASQSDVVLDRDARIEELKAGLADDTVLLEDRGAPAAEGGAADLGVVEDSPERISVQADAERGGYLVVADAVVRDGWTATVDGRPAPLVRANHAFAAVWVPAGEHRVELTYRAPGLRAGTAVSMASLVVAAATLLVPAVRRRRGAARSAIGPRGGGGGLV